ncbi:MAG: exo-alpha-sialidase [Clostridia bacterium]|nr:exo-alpha-sialidase [Clostridia bacterium]
MSMYNIWKKECSMPKVSELKTVKSEHVTIKPFEPEEDGYVFLHGVAIVKFKGRMYCAWAHNKVRENSDDEEVNYAISDDNGKTWSGCVSGNMNPQNGVAVSHGVFLVHEEKLYFFAPQFKGQMGAEMMKMSVYVLDKENEKFRYIDVAMNERFWPMCEPVLMENGNYIMPGIYVASDYKSPDNAAAVAISRGSDILHWDMVKIERAEDVKVWGECCIAVNGSNIKMYCREHSGKLKALYSESFDFGNTWSEMALSDLPMINSKPYAGTLSTGQKYLICSCAQEINARDPLTIAISEKGEDKFSKIYTIDSGKILSYPYAIEVDKKLYVAYSSTTEGFNRNSAELAIIDIEDLQP